MLGNGIGSIVFGLLYVAVTIFILLLGAHGMANVAVIVLAGLSALLALALLTAGILAIAGRDAYAEWRAAQGLDRGARQRTVEEEDYDDRPRRPPNEAD